MLHTVSRRRFTATYLTRIVPQAASGTWLGSVFGSLGHSGTVANHFNWESSTGVFRGDRWDPTYDPSDDVAASEWMSLYEYFDFTETTGMEPEAAISHLVIQAATI